MTEFSSMTEEENNATYDILSSIKCELARARYKFPSQDALTTLVGLAEEHGELAEAVLDYKIIDPKYKKGKTYVDVKKEAIQVAVMAIRVALDCGLDS